MASVAPNSECARPRPYLEPLAAYGLNLAVRTPLFFTDDPQKICFIVGRMLVIHNTQNNIYNFIQLDGIPGQINHVVFSSTRRLVAFAATSSNLLKIHIYSLRHKARVVMINIPEGQGLTGSISSLSFSIEDKFILAQLSPPDWPIIVWALPPFIHENASTVGETKPFKNVYIIPKPHALFKSPREIITSHFSPLHLNLIYGIASQNVHFMSLQDGAIKTMNVFSLKRMMGTFMPPVFMQHQDKEFSLLPIRQTGEVLILRKDHLCCFIPSEFIFGQRMHKTPGTGTVAQQYTSITQYMIKNHLDVLSADPNVREEITYIKTLQDDIFMIGSSFGRIIVYQILNFEPIIPSTTGADLPIVGVSSITRSVANTTGPFSNFSNRSQEYAITMPCRAAEGMSVRLPVFRILRSILLPCNFKAILSIDICPKDKRVLVYTDSGYIFVSRRLDRESLLSILATQQTLFSNDFKATQATIAAKEDAKLTSSDVDFKLSTLESVAKSTAAIAPPSSSILSFNSNLQNVVTNEILATAYETIRKIRYLIKMPKSLSQVNSLISLINPVNALTGTVANVKMSTQSTQLELSLYQTPQTWPSAIIDSSVFCPFSSYYQISSTIISSLAHQGVTLNGVLIDPSQYCTGYEFGRPLHIKNVPITAVSASDETGYVAIGNDNGEVFILNIITGTIVASWNWVLPDIYLENKKYDLIPDSQTTKLIADTQVIDGGKTKASALKLTVVSDNAIAGNQKEDDKTEPPLEEENLEVTKTNDFIAQTLETVRETPVFTITSLKIHPSGRHLLVSGRNKRDLGFVTLQDRPSRTSKGNRGYCVCILHIADSYMECISVIDCDSPCITIDFDKTGNYVYLLSWKSVYVFSFLEIRLIKRINLGQRFVFTPRANDFPSFSPQDMWKYKQTLKHVSREARPTCMAISEKLLVAVAFTDGDICLFNSLDGALLNRYLTGGFFFTTTETNNEAPQKQVESEQSPSPAAMGLSEVVLREEFDKLAGLGATSSTNVILKRKSPIVLSTHVIKLSFIEQCNFSPQGRLRYTATQGDKLPYTPLLAVLADGTATELDFVQQMWTVGRLGRNPDDAKIDIVSQSAAKCIGRLVQTTANTQDGVNGTDRPWDKTRSSKDVSDNPADNPLLAEYDNDRFNVAPTFSQFAATQGNNTGIEQSTTDTPMLGSTRGPLGRTVATIGTSASTIVSGKRAMFALPATNIYQLFNSQHYITINEENYLAFERYKSAYLNSLSLSYGIEAYSSWAKLTPPIITDAINAPTIRTETGRFLNYEGIFNGLLMNPHFLNNVSTVLISGSVTGAIVLSPYPITDQITNEYHQAYYNKKLHSAPVTHAVVIRGSYVLSCSVDGMILISRLRYPGLPFVTKPIPRSSLGLNHIVRSRSHQTTLDLLFFELLTRMLLVKQASLNCIHEVTVSSEQYLKQLMEKYFKTKKDSIKALSGAYIRHDRMLKRRSEILADRDVKQNVLIYELTQSFEKQISFLQYEKNKLIERLMHNEEQHGTEIKELKANMEKSVQEEKLLTKKQTEELRAQLEGLFEDERLLREQTEQHVDAANKSLEAEVASLKAKFSKAVVAEASNVMELRSSHKELEKEFSDIMKDTNNKKNTLMRARTESNQIMQALLVAKDTLEHLKADIVDRDAMIAEKRRTYRNIQKEKVDLEKVSIILKDSSMELKECIAPRDNLLADLATQANEMDAELQKDQQKRYESNLKITDLKLRRQGLSKELASKQESLGTVEESMHFILSDIRNIITNISSHELKRKELDGLTSGSKISQQLLSEALRLSNMRRKKDGVSEQQNARASSTSEIGSPLRKVHLSTAYTMANSIINSGSLAKGQSFKLSPQRRSLSSVNSAKSAVGSALPSGRSSVLETRHLDMTGGSPEFKRNRTTTSAAGSVTSSTGKGSENFALTAIAQALSKSDETVRDIHDTSIKYAQLIEQELEFHTKCGKGITSSIQSLYRKHCCDNSKSNKSLLNTAMELKDDPLAQISTLLSTQKTIMSDEMLARQRTYLERSVATLEKSLERRRTQLSQAIEKARTHSSELLALSNMMRRENKRLQQQLRAAKLQLIKKRPSSSLYSSKDAGFNETISRAVIQIENELRLQTEQAEGDTTEDTLDIFDETFKKPIEGVTITVPGGVINLETLQAEQTELDEYLNNNFAISRSPSPQEPQFLVSTKPIVLPTIPSIGKETSDSGHASSPKSGASRPNSRLGNFGLGELNESSEISGIGAGPRRTSARVSLPPLAKYRSKRDEQ